MATHSRYSCMENPMDRGASRATVHGVAKSQTRLKQLSMYHLEHLALWFRSHNKQPWLWFESVSLHAVLGLQLVGLDPVTFLRCLIPWDFIPTAVNDTRKASLREGSSSLIAGYPTAQLPIPLVHSTWKWLLCVSVSVSVCVLLQSVNWKSTLFLQSLPFLCSLLLHRGI